MTDSLTARATRVAAVALALAAWGCGGSPTAPQRDDVFYLHGGGVVDKNTSLEQYFPPLNQKETPRTPRIVGVGILNGDVRFGRPIDWYIRGADYSPEHRFISYQSPRQFLFTIIERVDSPEETWTDVLRRYEADVQQEGSQFLAARMPVGTANTQGRGYILKTRVPARPDFNGFTHEFLIRSEHRLLLVQVAHGDNIDAMADEIATAFKSIVAY
jgi:hypothetical protein